MHISELWRTALRPAILDAAEVSDAELLNRFRDAHDPVAFEVLVHRHGPMVWGACRRIIGNHHAAEDAFQATFLALAQRSGRIRKSAAAWLHRVAVRAGLDVLRRAKPNELPVRGREPIDRRPGPLQCAMAAELAMQIDVAIHRLPERLHQAFVLCDLQRYSLKEAATQLACPVGTVESRLARARRKLRGFLAGVQPAVGGALVVVTVPPALRAATVRTAFASGTVQPAIAALAARAAVGAGWGLAVPGLVTAMTAALLVAAVALGQPEAPKAAPKAPKTITAQDSTPKRGQLDATRIDLPQGAVVRLGSSRFRHVGSPMGDIAFSPDGKQLAVGDTLGVSVFETRTGMCLHRFPAAEGYMTRMVRFVANGKQLAIGSGDWNRAAEVTLMDLGTGKQLGSSRFTGKQQVFVIDVTEDGKRALVEDRFSKVFLWDIADAKEIWAFEHPEATSTMPLTADGKSLVLAMSQKAELRDALTGKVVADFPAPGKKFPAFYNVAAMSPDGKLAIASVDEEAVAILDARGVRSVQTFKAGHRVQRLFFSPDGRYLVGVSQFGTLVWDTTAKAGAGSVVRLPGAMGGGFSQAGNVLALDDVGFVSLWRVGEWKRMPQSADPASPVHSVRFSADGKQVLGYTQQGWVSWSLNGGPATRISDDSRVHHEGLSHVAADSRVAADVLHEPAAGRGEGKYALRVTDFTTGKARRIEIAKQVWNPVEMSPDGRFVFASLAGMEFVAWDATTGDVAMRRKQTLNDRFLLGAQLAKDGTRIVRSVAGVWKADGARPIPTGPHYSAIYVTDDALKREFALNPMPWSIYSGGARFSDDGSKVVILGHFSDAWRSDGVAIWDVRSGRLLLSFTRALGRLEAVQLSPDGRSMTIGDGAGKLAIVEIASAQERASFRHGGMILSAAFNTDGTKVVASSPEAPVYVWDLRGGARKWDAGKADTIWADLASADAKIAFTAMQTLRANPAEGTALLKERVKAPTVPPEAKIVAWLKQLDSSEFEKRDQAQKELAAVADVSQSLLEAARKGSSLEVLRRLDLIQLSTTDRTPERLRIVRVCEVLEGIGTPQASKVLVDLAAGPAAARLTTEALESVARLGRRR